MLIISEIHLRSRRIESEFAYDLKVLRFANLTQSCLSRHVVVDLFHCLLSAECQQCANVDRPSFDIEYNVCGSNQRC